MESGKTKCEALGYVKERVEKKLVNWKPKALSMGGKEVLIKAVACAVPAYMMACFKFPKKLCNSMNSSIAKFWWGQKAEERKVHWKSWLSMTMAKSMGGLGFKDLEVFNKALLAKQCWRLMKGVLTNALCARVLKGVYFHNIVFLKAKKGGRAS